jgi:HPt (histidine-containing phosphotransfer) domain-containing protein
VDNSAYNKVIENLRASYMSSLREKTVVFEQAAAVHSFDDIARLGHQLKGSGRSYGYAEITELGARIEDAGQNHQSHLFDELLVDLKQTILRLNPENVSEKL